MSWVKHLPDDDVQERTARLSDARARLAEAQKGGDLIDLTDSIRRRATDRYIQRLQEAFGKK